MVSIMPHRYRRASFRFMTAFLLVFAVSLLGGAAQGRQQAPSGSVCRIEPVDYRGWSGQQLANRWVKLVVVPQNGGRLMQVTFAGHDYLFVNPALSGKYQAPSAEQWFNYGGDKLWLLPEGDDDEQHWRGNSDLLDDGPYTFRKVAEGERCEIELASPADPQTGVQFIRTIALDTNSPHIQFHARMKNITGHTIEWSMQSVSQYDTGAAGDPGKRNPDIWGFTPANPASGYLNRYHVRFGPAENPAASVREDGLFAIHYAHLAAELWIDSAAGWLAVVDGTSRFAMVEKFEYEPRRTYPGRASVIFWTNGPELHLAESGEAEFGGKHDSPYYMEAELNSPMCRLKPGEECSFNTDWFPTRTASDIRDVSDAGLIVRPLRFLRRHDGKLQLSGAFGVFYAGHLVANYYDGRGVKLAAVQIADASPAELVDLHTEVSPGGKAARVSLHLIDEAGVDRGALQEVRLTAEDDH